MKKFIFASVLGFIMLFAANSANAQLNFFNNTPCWVRVMGAYGNNPNPCVMGPSCVSPWISVAPFGVGVLPAGNCPLPPAPTSNYFRIQINFGGGFFGASMCPNNPVPVVDCQNFPRTLQMFSFNTAAVF